MERADSFGKDPDASMKAGEGDDRGQMVGWHSWLNGHEFEQTLGESEGKGSLACCSLWGRKRVGHLSD